MDLREQADRAAALPDRFRDRIDPATMRFIDDYISEGQWDLALEYLLGSLSDLGTAVTPDELAELRTMADSVGLSPEHLSKLKFPRRAGGSRR